MSKPLKIVIAGAPSTGKTIIINKLKSMGYLCKNEVSRQIIRQGREKGIEQYFLKNPLQFSRKIIKQRKEDYLSSIEAKSSVIFFDRGLPETLAYLNYINRKYPKHMEETCYKHRYDNPIFIAPLWKEIYTKDNERVESFEESKKVEKYIKNIYTSFDYNIHELPFISVEKRVNYILERLNILK